MRLTLSILGCIVLLTACEKPAEIQPNYFATIAGENVLPTTALSFPADHGAHNQQGIEWWYVTSNLHDNDGNQYGVQWTLFRIKNDKHEIESPWWDDNIYFAHFAVETKSQHYAFERLGRAQQATISAMPFNASIDNWSLRSKQTSFLPLSLSANSDKVAVKLSLDGGPRIIHGENGFSQKTPQGHASLYFSYPLLRANGTLSINGEDIEVTGSAWLDREWSGGLMDNTYAGWDWFSIQSDNLSQGLMVFCLRNQAQQQQYCRGSTFDDSGQLRSLSSSEIKLRATKTSTLDAVTYPIAWQLDVTGIGNMQITNRNADSRNLLTIPYWEGRIEVTGDIKGVGYVELVGYN